MSKTIFRIDYSECRDTNREVNSIFTYIDEINEIINEMNGHVSLVADNQVWSKGKYNEFITDIKGKLKDEKDRYTNFYNQFSSFQTIVEETDGEMENLLKSQLSFIEDNEDYNIYVSILQMNQGDEFEDEIFEQLKAMGMSEEDARKISLFFNKEAREKIIELSKMEKGDIEKELQKIADDADKGYIGYFLLEICGFGSPSGNMDVFKDIAAEFATGQWVGAIEKSMLGKSLQNYNLDINSLNGMIASLESKIISGNLSNRKIQLTNDKIAHLTNIRNSKVSNASKVTATTSNLATLSKWVGYAAIAYQVGEITYENFEDFYENGVEADNAVVNWVIDGAGIVACITGGAAVGEWAGGVVGGIIGSAGVVTAPAAAAIGAGAGMVVGAIAGGVIGVLYEGIVKPIAVNAYEDIIEPGCEWLDDKFNDLGDWWDTLGW